MKLSQIGWAKLHDWYRDYKAEPVNGDMQWSVVAYDSTEDKLVTFTDYQELRNWAGY